MSDKALRPVFVVVLSAFCVAAGAGLGWMLRAPAAETHVAASTGTTTRLGGYTFVRPLLECDVAADTDQLRFQALHDEIEGAVARAVSTGAATHVSVYLRDLNSTRVLGINANEGFSPASLLKVPVLITALRAAARDPTILDRQIAFTGARQNTLTQNIPPGRVLEAGRSYSVWTLIEQMIIESDNAAMETVGGLFTPTEYLRTFADLGVPPPDTSGRDPNMTVEQYASFFRILYNAAYLDPELSEKALQLLSRVRFVSGIVAGVPATVAVAHKFGERRYAPDGVPAVDQLHDCGVVYFPGRPYLLCLMTRGEAWGPLTDTLRTLSTIVYRHYERVASAPQGVASSGSP